MRRLRVGVVGATGLAGSEIIRVLEERDFPVVELRPFASERSQGRPIPFRGTAIPCRVLEDGALDGLDLVLMEAPAELAREWAPRALAAGAVVVDNSSAFRYDDEVPLVVPEVNGDRLDGHRGLVASPNCTTLSLVPVLAPLDRAFGLRRVSAVSFQAVSGAGQAALVELRQETETFLERTQELARSGVAEQSFTGTGFFPRPIGFNVIPQADDFVGDQGLTKEEHKLIVETRKILGRPDLAVSPFCVRVPVWVGHSLAVTCELERAAGPEAAEVVLGAAGGVRLWSGRDYPTPLEIAGTDGTHVGRVRRDPGLEAALVMWVCGDNLRKGAGLNNVQIAEELLARDLLRVPGAAGAPGSRRSSAGPG
jgi:aspartate-semialdehyde dehydrogenase